MSITRLRTLSHLFSASPEAAGWFLLSGQMDHISLLTIPVFGCVTSEQKPPLRIRKCLFIQELRNLGKHGSHGPAFLSPLPGAVLCLLTAQGPGFSSADKWVLRVFSRSFHQSWSYSPVPWAILTYLCPNLLHSCQISSPWLLNLGDFVTWICVPVLLVMWGGEVELWWCGLLLCRPGLVASEGSDVQRKCWNASVDASWGLPLMGTCQF